MTSMLLLLLLVMAGPRATGPPEGILPPAETLHRLRAEAVAAARAGREERARDLRREIREIEERLGPLVPREAAGRRRGEVPASIAESRGGYLGQRWRIDHRGVVYWDGEPYVRLTFTFSWTEAQVRLLARHGIRQFALPVPEDLFERDERALEEAVDGAERVADRIEELGGTFFAGLSNLLVPLRPDPADALRYVERSVVEIPPGERDRDALRVHAPRYRPRGSLPGPWVLNVPRKMRLLRYTGRSRGYLFDLEEETCRPVPAGRLAVRLPSRDETPRGAEEERGGKGFAPRFEIRVKGVRIPAGRRLKLVVLHEMASDRAVTDELGTLPAVWRPRVRETFLGLVRRFRRAFRKRGLRAMDFGEEQHLLDIPFINPFQLYPDLRGDPIATSAYRRWLRRTFGDIDRLNRHLGTHHRSFDEIRWRIPLTPIVLPDAVYMRIWRGELDTIYDSGLVRRTFGVYDSVEQMARLDALQWAFRDWLYAHHLAGLAREAQAIVGHVPTFVASSDFDDHPLRRFRFHRMLMEEGMEGMIRNWYTVPVRGPAGCGAVPPHTHQDELPALLELAMRRSGKTKTLLANEIGWPGREGWPVFRSERDIRSVLAVMGTCGYRGFHFFSDPTSPRARNNVRWLAALQGEIVDLMLTTAPPPPEAGRKLTAGRAIAAARPEGEGGAGPFDRAQWIWCEGEEIPKNFYLYCRKAFTLQEKVASARVHVTADSRYKLYVNGTFVGRGPVRCDQRRQYYDTYDIAAHLRTGGNVIAATVHQYGVPTHSYTLGRGGFLLQGTAGGQALDTDGSWKVLPSPAWEREVPRVSPAIMWMEIYDARKAPAGWRRPGFDDARWQAARELGKPPVDPWESLVPRDIPFLLEKEIFPTAVVDQGTVGPVREGDVARRMAREPHHPGATPGLKEAGKLLGNGDGPATVSTAGADGGIYVILDFGREVSGYVRLRLKGVGGGIVDLGYSEVLADGRLDIGREGSYHFADRYVMCDGPQEWESFFWKGFRYLQVTFRSCPKPVEVESVSLVFTSYPVEYRGAFECSDSRLDRIWEVGRWTLQLCMHDGYEDTPWREQGQWVGDAQVEMLANYMTFGDVALGTKYLRQIAGGQARDGSLPAMYPAAATVYPGRVAMPSHAGIPTFMCQWVSTLLDHYRYTGERGVVAELYPHVKRVMGYFDGFLDDHGLLAGVPGFIFLDWGAAFHAGPGGERAELTGLNCHYHRALLDAAELASIEKDEEKRKEWLRGAETVKNAINERLWSEEKGVYLAGLSGGRPLPRLTVHDTVLAVWSGVAPPGRIERGLAALFRSSPGEFTWIGTPYFYFFYLGALRRARKHREALDVVREAYGGMLERGATSWWEHFSGRASRSHGWSCAPNFDLSRHVLGVEPVEPGFAAFRVEPHPSGLQWARGTIPTVRGDVEVEWRRDGDVFELRVEVPMKAAVELSLPSAKRGGRERHSVSGPGSFRRTSTLPEDGPASPVKTLITARDVVARPGPGQGGGPPRSLREKMRRLQEGVRRWREEGRDLSPVGRILEDLEPLLKEGRLEEAEAVLDRALRILDEDRAMLRKPIRVPMAVQLLGFAPSGGPVRRNDPARWEEDRRLTSEPGESRTTINFAHGVAADDSGRVHAVWYDTRDGTPQVYYKRSTNDGRTWGPDVRLSRKDGANEHPSVAVSGPRVYVVWHRRGDDGVAVLLRRSADGGATWEPEVRLTDSGAAAHASAAVSGSRVHLVWVDTRTGVSEIYYRRSTDSGRTWEKERRLTDEPFASWVPSVAAAGELVVLAWVDGRDGNEEEYVRVSTDGGVTWDDAVRLTDNRMNSWAPSVAAWGDTVHVVWFDQKANAFDALDAERKVDEAMRLVGLEPEPAPKGVLVPDPEGAAKWRTTKKLMKIQREHRRWIERGGDEERLGAIMQEFEERMRGARGARWSHKERKLDEALELMGISYDPGPAPKGVPGIYYGDALAMRVQRKIRKVREAAPEWVERGGDPRKVEVLLKEFHRMSEASGKEWEIYYRRSDDRGRTWGAEKRLTRAPGASLRPNLAVSGKDLHVVWFDGRDGDVEVYYKGSSDGGDTWGPDTRLTDARGESGRPAVAVSRGAVHVVWFDLRDGAPEIYYKRKGRE